MTSNKMKIVDILDENELIDILVGSFKKNGESDVVAVNCETASYILSELIKLDDYSIGLVELETGIYDDYEMELYHVMIDADANICVEKAYSICNEYGNYGKPLIFDANAVWVDQEIVDQEYIDFLEDCDMNIIMFGYYDESDDLLELFEYDKCIDCDHYDECWSCNFGSCEDCFNNEQNDINENSCNNNSEKSSIDIIINGKNYTIDDLKESDIYKHFEKITRNIINLYKW